MNSLKIFIIMSCLFNLGNAWAEPKVKSKVIIKYKQYESFDLGNLEIKGKIIAPGDLSVKERQRKRFSRPLFERDEFDPEVREDIQNLR
ncbi:MAG: hypothetical protein NXH75_07005 [Halobacteriovoraceae bacterium]|nr:hypothetical protein [Halobacteriovoraceae bacterium]